MTYAIEYTKKAVKQMAVLPAPVRAGIVKKIEVFAQSPGRAAQVKALKGEEGAYRLRVGDYRVVYYLEHGRLVVVVVKVQHRKDVYR